jgi:transketolase
VETGIEQGWEKYLGPRGRFIGMTSYGASAPVSAVMKHFGFTVDNVVAKSKELLARK